MPKIVKRRNGVEDEVEEPSPVAYHLYRVIFRRMSNELSSSKSRTFVTFGVDEQDARERVWEAYRGSSFHDEYTLEGSSAEFILGGVLKIGGN